MRIRSGSVLEGVVALMVSTGFWWAVLIAAAHLH
jgi:hypothetical protein